MSDKQTDCAPAPDSATYTVSRCKNDDTLFGRIHLADIPIKTRCGKIIDDKWWIITNDGTGKGNCPACLCSPNKQIT